MLSHDYSYADILKNSLKVAWTERQVLEGRDFDYSKRFLPNRLSGVDGIRCLNEREKLKLNQIMGNAYCHIFAYVEEYIIPQALEAAQKDIYGDETRLRTLLRFAEDESKHQELFRRSTALFEQGFGVKLWLDPRPRRSGQGRVEQVAAMQLPADQHDRVVHAASLRRARSRSKRARRAVP